VPRDPGQGELQALGGGGDLAVTIGRVHRARRRRARRASPRTRPRAPPTRRTAGRWRTRSSGNPAAPCSFDPRQIGGAGARGTSASGWSVAPAQVLAVSSTTLVPQGLGSGSPQPVEAHDLHVRAGGTWGSANRRAGRSRRSRRRTPRSSRRCGSTRSCRLGRSSIWGTIPVFTWLDLVGDPGRVRQVEGVDLEREQLVVLERDLEVVDHRAPDVELGNVDAVEAAEVLRWVLEERPLAALEVGRQE
jgi:hypothetical protein